MRRYLILFFILTIASFIGVYFQESNSKMIFLNYQEGDNFDFISIEENSNCETCVDELEYVSELFVDLVGSVKDLSHTWRYESKAEATWVMDHSNNVVGVSFPANKENFNLITKSIEDEFNIDGLQETIYNGFLENDYAIYKEDGFNIYVLKDNAELAKIFVEIEMKAPNLKKIDEQIRQKNFYVNALSTGGKKDLIIYEEWESNKIQVAIQVLDDIVEKVSITANSLDQPITEDELAIITKSCLLLGLTELEINEVFNLLIKTAPNNTKGKIGEFKYDIKNVYDLDDNTFKFSIEK
ncbi:hypothetical protein AN641_09290 [Candidatus Epulonipiscioides gigas]|nr:hypothetical protein AN641_09290 [Epulopiscium sp. SCG-C07WGA-EpuloA2]